MRRNLSNRPEPPEPPNRAYLVRNLNMQWAAKRASDGSVICEKGDRIEAAAEAINYGYVFLY